MVHFSLYWVKTQRHLHLTPEIDLYFTSRGTETCSKCVGIAFHALALN